MGNSGPGWLGSDSAKNDTHTHTQSGASKQEKEKRISAQTITWFNRWLQTFWTQFSGWFLFAFGSRNKQISKHKRKFFNISSWYLSTYVLVACVLRYWNTDTPFAFWHLTNVCALWRYIIKMVFAWKSQNWLVQNFYVLDMLAFFGVYLSERNVWFWWVKIAIQIMHICV